MKRAKARDPSKEPYASPWSDKQRLALPGPDLLAEYARASAKAAVAKYHKERGIRTEFVAPDLSEASATAIVGVTFDMLDSLVTAGERSKAEKIKGGKNRHQASKATRSIRDAAIWSEYERRLTLSEPEHRLVARLARMTQKPGNVLSGFDLGNRQVRRIIAKKRK